MSKEHGAVIINGVQVSSTQQCCHCGSHFKLKSGQSEFCPSCSEFTCGQPKCHICLPKEVQLDYLEGTKIPYKYEQRLEEYKNKGFII